MDHSRKSRLLDPEAVTTVEPQQQLEFLSNVQRLLSEGQFTATYKYALLLAIADICVEDGEDDGASFVIQTSKIAEKFITYYWPQARPYEGVVLRQNTGKAPAIISALCEVAENGVVALHELKRDIPAWSGRSIAWFVKCPCGSFRSWATRRWNSFTKTGAKAPRLNLNRA